MATIERDTPVGVDVRSFGAPWQIAGVTIDNPSGSWLRIPAVDRFIPPYTVRWTTNFTPTILTLDVLFVDSPSGTPSDNVGGPITITISDTPLPDSIGQSSGAIQAQSPIGTRILTVPTNVIFSLGPSIIIGPASPSINIVPIRVGVTYAMVPVLGDPLITPYGVTTIWIRSTNGLGVGFGLTQLAISPESPYVDYTFTEGFFLDPTFSVEAEIFPEPGVGDVALSFIAQYYNQTVVG